VRECHFLGSGVPAKQLRSWSEGMRVWRDRKRDRVGWEGRGWESKLSAGSAPNPSHGTKMLGKMPFTMKAHEKSLTSKNKV
jgi:hypothetical protein